MRTIDIKLKSNPSLGTILDKYCEDLDVIPTEKGKRFFKQWNTKVPAKLIRQAMFSGIYWAKKHPEDVIIEEEGEA